MDLRKNAHFNFWLFITTLDTAGHNGKSLRSLLLPLSPLPSRQAGEKKYF